MYPAYEYADYIELTKYFECTEYIIKTVHLVVSSGFPVSNPLDKPISFTLVSSLLISSALQLRYVTS